MTTRVGFSHTMILPLRKLLRGGGVYGDSAHQGVCGTGIPRYAGYNIFALVSMTQKRCISLYHTEL